VKVLVVVVLYVTVEEKYLPMFSKETKLYCCMTGNGECNLSADTVPDTVYTIECK
jgi:hypothetical protein